MQPILPYEIVFQAIFKVYELLKEDNVDLTQGPHTYRIETGEALLDDNTHCIIELTDDVENGEFTIYVNYAGAAIKVLEDYAAAWIGFDEADCREKPARKYAHDMAQLFDYRQQGGSWVDADGEGGE